MQPRKVALALLAAVLSSAAQAQHARVDALADRFVAAYRDSFALYYEGSALPDPRVDQLNANSPGDLAAWRARVDSIDRAAAGIDPALLRGTPQANTLAILRQAAKWDRASAICAEELWHVASDDWLLDLLQAAELQDVGDDAGRTAALARFARVPGLIDQETRNLRTGLARGFSAARSAVDDKLQALDQLLAAPLDESALMSPAKRSGSAAFAQRWRKLIEGRVRPAFARHRDFLRATYRPRARTNPAVTANPNGAECYRATIAATVTMEVDPELTYQRGVDRVRREQTDALALARRHYGRSFASLAELNATLAADAANHFDDAAALTRFIEQTIAGARERSARVVPNLPEGEVVLKPFPNENSPSGQYIPSNAEGTRPATYYYRADFRNLSPAALESTVLHEVWPGHHLQFVLSRARNRGRGHPIAQLVFLPGIGEGWATYVESLGRELELYGSDVGAMASVMDSMTPRMVADLGVHVRGWTEEQAMDYLVGAIPALPPSRLKGTIASIVASPGRNVPYAAGAMEIEALRKRAEAKGAGFDLRRFHELILEDGTVPFSMLAEKVDRER